MTKANLSVRTRFYIIERKNKVKALGKSRVSFMFSWSDLFNRTRCIVNNMLKELLKDVFSNCLLQLHQKA